MTWTKFGAEFRDECAEAGLSDAAFRTHVEAIMYLYGIEAMDMQLKSHLIRRWAGSDNYQSAVEELVAKGYWAAVSGGWRVVHHEHVFRQSLGYQTRERDRSRRAMQKARDKGQADPNVVPDVTQDVTRNVMRTQTDSQTDKQQLQEAEVSTENIDLDTGEVLDLFSSTTPTETVVDPWAAPTPQTLCAQCRGWVGMDREKAGLTVCGPCVRGERKAS